MRRSTLSCLALATSLISVLPALAAEGAIPELELWRKLHDAGVYSQPLTWFHIEPERATCHGLLMSFASWPERDTAEAFRRLAALFK